VVRGPQCSAPQTPNSWWEEASCPILKPYTLRTLGCGLSGLADHVGLSPPPNIKIVGTSAIKIHYRSMHFATTSYIVDFSAHNTCRLITTQQDTSRRPITVH